MPAKKEADAPVVTFPPDLQRGEVMFAKIYGFPWWPSVARSVRRAYDEAKPEVRVRFCNDPTDATLPPKDLKRFTDVPDWHDVKAFKFKSATVKKQWEKALADAQKHTVDPDAVWSDDEDARAEAAHVEQEALWTTEPHEWMHRRVARQLGGKKGKLFLGTIVKWIAADEEYVASSGASGDGPLFHVVHDDGDEEDLEDFEVKDGFKLYLDTPESKKKEKVQEKAARDEAKTVRKAAKEAMAAVQGPRSALLFFKLECEACLGEAADPQMEVEEVSELLRASYDELPDGDKQWYEHRAEKDQKRWERDKKRKRKEVKAEGQEAGGGGEGEGAADGDGEGDGDGAADDEGDGEGGGDENGGDNKQPRLEPAAADCVPMVDEDAPGEEAAAEA